jgi:AraC family transcriptional regulator
MTQFTPTFKNGQAALLTGIRHYHLYTDAATGIPQQWLRFNELRQSSNPTLSGVSYGVVCGSDADGFEYMCAVETPSFDSFNVGDGRLKLLPQHYLVLIHEGNISSIKETWQAIWRWLPTTAYKIAHKPVFERYDERFNGNTGNGLVELWIPIEQN